MAVSGSMASERMRQSMAGESGFTLIELIMVIVILGILGAVALPKFVDLSADAEQASVKGIAGGLGAASAINRAVCAVGNANCVAVADCTSIGPLLDGGLPNDSNGKLYTITSGVIAKNNTTTCKVSDSTASFSADFIGHGT